MYFIKNKNSNLTGAIVSKNEIRDFFIAECNLCIDNNEGDKKQIKLWQKEIEKCENEIYSIEDIIEILEKEFDYTVQNFF